MSEVNRWSWIHLQDMERMVAMMEKAGQPVKYHQRVNKIVERMLEYVGTRS